MGRTILIATLLLSLCFSGVVMQKEHPFLNKDPLAVGATPANGPDNSLNADGKCFFSDKDTVSPVSVRLVINENDLGLVMLDNDGTAIGDVSWSCFLIDYSEFKDNKDYIEPSDGAQTCKGTGNKKNYFIRQGPVTMDTGVNEVQYRTHIIEVDGIVNTDGTGKPCGGEIDGDDIFYVAKCRRDIDFTQLGDIKVIFKMDKTKCAVKTQDTDGTVIKDVEITGLERKPAVTFDLYSGEQGATTYTDIDVLNAAYVTSKTLKTDSSHKIVSPVNIAELGEPLYFEVCIDIADSRHYFRDGIDAFGVFVTSCSAVPTVGDTLFRTPAVPVTMVDADGCGAGDSLALQWTTDKVVFGYGKGDADDNNPWLEAPNCFRSQIFEAVSLARKNIMENIIMTVTCELDYCDDKTDQDCFGDRDTCPRVTRRKRSVDGSFFDANLPSTVSVNYTVKALGSKSDETLTTAKAGCFDKSIFISLVSVLSLTLLVLVVSAIYLGIRLRMRSNHDEMTSSGTLSGPRTISSKASSLYSNK
ncbi:uncharacterized protein LOC128221068 [Mya arenaria]|uniref:uncharacterized protein LOC128221068 n=1 Tax=Mya arenaria TaxID=6604 RepID=UPI0022E2AC32|nr:uncharacterized protein LOC128221068 [Mya arenaria]